MDILRIRKLADTTGGERVRRYDPDTGHAKLVNPATPGDDHEPWPLLGVEIVGEPPAATTISTNKVDEGIAEGWIALEGERAVVRPGGPAADMLRVRHKFTHADTVVFNTVNGDIRYRVVHQPDKYVTVDGEQQPITPATYTAGPTHVDHFYGLELEG